MAGPGHQMAGGSIDPTTSDSSDYFGGSTTSVGHGPLATFRATLWQLLQGAFAGNGKFPRMMTSWGPSRLAFDNGGFLIRWPVCVHRRDAGRTLAPPVVLARGKVALTLVELLGLAVSGVPRGALPKAQGPRAGNPPPKKEEARTQTPSQTLTLTLTLTLPGRGALHPSLPPSPPPRFLFIGVMAPPIWKSPGSYRWWVGFEIREDSTEGQWAWVAVLVSYWPGLPPEFAAPSALRQGGSLSEGGCREAPAPVPLPLVPHGSLLIGVLR